MCESNEETKLSETGNTVMKIEYLTSCALGYGCTEILIETDYF